jgi:hypothetical protein
MRTLLTLSLVLTLSACGLVELPDETEEVAVYYVSTNQTDSLGLSTLIAIEYETPDGTAFDTLRAPDTATPTASSWTATFPREALSAMRLTATNLTPPLAEDSTNTPAGFVGASLFVNQDVLAEDSSRIQVSLSN